MSESLRSAGIQCLDVHFLEQTRILKMLRTYFENPDGKFIPEHILDSLLVKNVFVRQKAVRIITLIRNPIMRNISAVFQNMPTRLKDDRHEIMERLRKYSANIPDVWFKRDFIPVTGIDVFNKEIDSSADHFRFSKGRFEVLIIKLETNDEQKSRLLSDFVGKDIELIRTNEALNKWYRSIYQQVVSDPKSIRDSYIKECVNLKYYKKFYSEEERKRIFEKAA